MFKTEESERRQLARELHNRIAQEAAINTLEHAQANDITLTLSADAATATLVIADNGRSFDPMAAHAHALGHLGMVNMRERAESIDGGLRVESASGAGTRVMVGVPRRAPAYNG